MKKLIGIVLIHMVLFSHRNTIVAKSCSSVVYTPSSPDFLDVTKFEGGSSLQIRNIKENPVCKWTIINPNPVKYDVSMIYFKYKAVFPDCAVGQVYFNYVTSKLGPYCDDNFKYKYPVMSLTNIEITLTSLASSFYLDAYYEVTNIGCAVTLEFENGILPHFVSKTYPNNYRADSHCLWYIPRILKFQVLYLVFFEIILDSRQPLGKCNLVDNALWLTQWRLNNATTIFKICGRNQMSPLPIALYESQRSSVVLHTNKERLLKGFSAAGFLSDTECGGIFYDVRGTIEPPRLSGRYKNGKQCVWLLHSDKNDMTVFLVFHQFHLQSTVNCKNDFLEIFQPYDTNIGYKRPERYCDTIAVMKHQNPPTYFRFNDNLALRFVSDETVSYSGFEISYFRSDSSCGGGSWMVSKDDHRKVELSDYYENHASNQPCSWFYYSSRILSVIVDMVEMDVGRNDSDANKCTGDHISIYTGVLNKRNKPKFVVCNPEKYKVETNRLLLVFEPYFGFQRKKFTIKLEFKEAEPAVSIKSFVSEKIHILTVPTYLTY